MENFILNRQYSIKTKLVATNKGISRNLGFFIDFNKYAILIPLLANDYTKLNGFGLFLK